MSSVEPVLRVEDLTVGYRSDSGIVRVLNDVSFSVQRGEFVAIVGESGCGKSMTCLAVSQLLPHPVEVLSGSIRFGHREVVGMSERELRELRGQDFSLVFQDPQSSLNPTMRIERQIAEALRLHTGASRRQGRQRAVELLRTVGFPNAEAVLRSFPHELSGGMRQRVAIAMALACVPSLLMADEPTSALDATVQAQVIGLLKRIQAEFELAVLFVTHDLQLVSHVADRVIVMYAGRVVESGPVAQVIASPQHAYTRDLLACVPSTAVRLGGRLARIPGAVPDLLNLPSGCAYHPRCSLATDECRRSSPSVAARGDHAWACHHPGQDVRALVSRSGAE